MTVNYKARIQSELKEQRRILKYWVELKQKTDERIMEICDTEIRIRTLESLLDDSVWTQVEQIEYTPMGR